MNWEIIKNYFINGDEAVSLILTLLSIISFFIGLSINKIKNNVQNRKRKKILSIKNNLCAISIPTFNVQVFSDVSSMVLTDEAIIQQKIINFCSKLNITTVPFNNNANFIGDEIHIGGPSTNLFANYYIHSYFPKFKWMLTPQHYSNYAAKIEDKLNKSVFMINEKDDVEGFVYDSNPNNVLRRTEKTQDYAVLIKMTSEDFNIGNKNVHILFGAGRIGTKAAIEYFINCYDQLYKKYKGKHYFIAFPVNKKSGMPMNKNNPIDLTSIMFSDAT